MHGCQSKRRLKCLESWCFCTGKLCVWLDGEKILCLQSQVLHRQHRRDEKLVSCIVSSIGHVYLTHQTIQNNPWWTALYSWAAPVIHGKAMEPSWSFWYQRKCMGSSFGSEGRKLKTLGSCPSLPPQPPSLCCTPILSYKCGLKSTSWMSDHIGTIWHHCQWHVKNKVIELFIVWRFSSLLEDWAKGSFFETEHESEYLCVCLQRKQIDTPLLCERVVWFRLNFALSAGCSLLSSGGGRRVKGEIKGSSNCTYLGGKAVWFLWFLATIKV